MTNVTNLGGIIQITMDSNLSKNYFNPNVSFTASSENLVFYIKINGDAFEIPLDKLEVSGSAPASLTDGINALATLFSS